MDELRIISRALAEARRSGRFVVAIPVACALTAFVLTFLVPSTYRSSATIVAEAKDPSRALGGLAGLAAQLGAPLPSSVQSPQFFAEILRSRDLLVHVLYSPAGAALDRPDSVAIIDLLVARGADSLRREERAIRRLRKSIATTVGSRTGIIEISVGARSPALAATLAGRLVQELESFNRDKRNSQARERRRFTEQRLKEAQDSLSASEEAIEAFSLRNRSFRGAPQLELAFQRLQRRVAAFQELTTSLRKEYESSRIAEVDDTPVITLLDAPVVPVRRSSPRRALAAAAGLFLGAMAVVVLLLGQAYRAERRAQGEQSQELEGTVGA